MAELNGIGFPGFKITDPSTWVPAFGSWGGPDWSAGERSSGPLTDAQKAAPVAVINDRPSPVDAACKTHDLAYDAAAGQTNEAQLKLQADLQLERDIANLPWSDLSGQESTYATLAAAAFAAKIALADPAMIGFEAIQAEAKALWEKTQSLAGDIGKSFSKLFTDFFHSNALAQQDSQQQKLTATLAQIDALISKPLDTPVTTNTINGDLSPNDVDPEKAGIQAVCDAQNNPIDGTAQPYADTLGGTAGNDHITAGELNDDVGGRAGDDWIEGGAGSDYLGGWEGNDLIEGGAGSDILAGGADNDQLYADTKTDIASATTNGNTGTGSGQKGDWLAGNSAIPHSHFDSHTFP